MLTLEKGRSKQKKTFEMQAAESCIMNCSTSLRWNSFPYVVSKGDPVYSIFLTILFWKEKKKVNSIEKQLRCSLWSGFIRNSCSCITVRSPAASLKVISKMWSVSPKSGFGCYKVAYPHMGQKVATKQLTSTDRMKLFSPINQLLQL